MTFARRERPVYPLAILRAFGAYGIYMARTQSPCGVGRPAALELLYLRQAGRSLRLKLEQAPSKPKHALTAPRIGYRLFVEHDAPDA